MPSGRDASASASDRLSLGLDTDLSVSELVRCRNTGFVGVGTMLRRFETVALFLAVMLGVFVEGSFVYWIWLHPIVPQLPESSLSYAGRWMSPALPQCWLIGAVLALFYYLIPIAHPAVRLEPDERIAYRRTFLRIWWWFLALAGAQGCALYLNYFAVLHR